MANGVKMHSQMVFGQEKRMLFGSRMYNHSDPWLFSSCDLTPLRKNRFSAMPKDQCSQPALSGTDQDKIRVKRVGQAAGGRPKKGASMPTTAPNARTHHINLTYGQWVIIFDFIKANPKVKQYQVVDHFTAKGWQLTQGVVLT